MSGSKGILPHVVTVPDHMHCKNNFTFCKAFFRLMLIADGLLLGQSASILNLYDNNGRSPQAE